MTGFRLAAGGSAIDRARPLHFRFDGRELCGFEGDTLASALIGNGITIAGRSFKYHRPRGVVADGFDETNALVQLGAGDLSTPNLPATLVALHEGLVARPVNCWPNARFDLGAINGLAKPLLTAGFYYKTFMWPRWHLFEGLIRRAAGLGRAPQMPDPEHYALRHASVDRLVIGAGGRGRAAAELGPIGGTGRILLLDRGDIAPRPGIDCLPRTTAVACLDHGLVLAVEVLDGAAAPGRLRERLWLIRAGEIVIATGDQERPLVFGGNDRPGVMLAGAVRRNLDRHAVLPGRRMLVATTNASTDDLPDRLRAAGVAVTVADARQGVQLLRAIGGRGVQGAELQMPDGSRTSIACDAIAMSGGFQPAAQLFLQAGGRLERDPATGALHAGGTVPGMTLALPPATDDGPAIPAPVLAEKRLARTAFVDFQTDVTIADIAQAVDENYRAPDHLKRYTVLGMGTDQGRLSAANGAAALAHYSTNRATALPTKARPPLVPVAFGTLAAGRPNGEMWRPRKYLPAHAFHLARGAAMADYGWERPSHYPQGTETLAQAARREAGAVRTTAGLMEASPLGKIELKGPDAARFLDHIYVGTMSTLKPGRVRYGLMLNENGSIFDDGVAMRLAEDHFLLNCTSGHADRVFAWLDEHHQCEWRHDLVMQDVTTAWATFAIAGPAARAVLAAAGTDIAFAPDAFPHLSVRTGRVAGHAARVARVSFSGEVCYEISVQASAAMPLAEALWDAGRAHGLVPYGIEALEILRVEKGYIHVGADTDSETQPGDIGFGAMWPKKAADFIGRRSLLRAGSLAPGRRQLVGLALEDPAEVLPMGAHIKGDGQRSIGWVGSSYDSPALGRGVALALLENGRARHGEPVEVFSLGRSWTALVTPPTAFDAEGTRLND